MIVMYCKGVNPCSDMAGGGGGRTSVRMRGVMNIPLEKIFRKIARLKFLKMLKFDEYLTF